MKTVLLVLLVGGFIYSSFITQFLTAQQAIIYLTILILVSLEIIETRLAEISKGVGQPPKIFRNARESDEYFNELIQIEEPEKSYILAMSASTTPSKSAFNSLRDVESEIHLLVKHPSTAIDNREKNIIKNGLEELYEFQKSGDVNIRLYREQASVKSVFFNSHLQLGWYTFDNRDPDERPVWGHKNPMMVLSNDEFEDFSIMITWLMRVYYELWDEAESLKDIWERERPPEVLDDWFQEGDDQERSRKESWVQSVSEKKYEGINEMFEKYERFASIADLELTYSSNT